MRLVYLRQTILEGTWKCFFIAIRQYLLEYPNTINDIDENGYTLLHHAAQHGCFEIVTCLLDYHANIHAKTPYGETAFMFAAAKGSVTVMELLRKYGAQINICDKFKSTALMKAVCQKKKYAVLFLLKNGVFLNAQDNNGQTALGYAAGLGEHELTALLIHKGANTSQALQGRGPQFVGQAFIQAQLADFNLSKKKQIEQNYRIKQCAQSSGFYSGFYLGLDTTLKQKKLMSIIKNYLFEPTQIELHHIFQNAFNEAVPALLFTPSVAHRCAQPYCATSRAQSACSQNVQSEDQENIIGFFGLCNIS